MNNEEITGKNRDLVEKKLEDIRKKNNINLNKNNEMNFKNNIDIIIDDDEDIWEENEIKQIKNENNENKFGKNLRDDDAFYKCDGNKLDFSENVFEKNKKILENINFFEDNDNINTNKSNNNNDMFDCNNYNDNNFNCQNKNNKDIENLNVYKEQSNFFNYIKSDNNNDFHMKNKNNYQSYNNPQLCNNFIYETNNYNFTQQQNYGLAKNRFQPNYINDFKDKHAISSHMNNINKINDWDFFNPFN